MTQDASVAAASIPNHPFALIIRQGFEAFLYGTDLCLAHSLRFLGVFSLKTIGIDAGAIIAGLVGLAGKFPVLEALDDVSSALANDDAAALPQTDVMTAECGECVEAAGRLCFGADSVRPHFREVLTQLQTIQRVCSRLSPAELLAQRRVSWALLCAVLAPHCALHRALRGGLGARQGRWDRKAARLTGFWHARALHVAVVATDFAAAALRLLDFTALHPGAQGGAFDHVVEIWTLRGAVCAAHVAGDTARVGLGAGQREHQEERHGPPEGHHCLGR